MLSLASSDITASGATQKQGVARREDAFEGRFEEVETKSLGGCSVWTAICGPFTHPVLMES